MRPGSDTKCHGVHEIRTTPLGVHDIVFVGGAIVGLLISDPAAAEPRAMIDVDAVTSIDSRKEFNDLEPWRGFGAC